MKQDDIDTYISLAKAAADRSKAKRLQVGAVIVNPNRVMAFGYNGTPPGWDNSCEDENNVTLPETIHGELNAIFKFIQDGIPTVGCSLFLTHSPCLPCAQIINLAGITKVVYVDPYRCDKGIKFLEKAGIDISRY